MKIILILLLISGPLFAHDKKINLKQIETFRWLDYRVGVMYSLQQIDKTYDIQINHDHKNAYRWLKISVLNDGKIIFKFEGHAGMSFDIKDDKIYYSQFNRNSSGCKLFAYDLKTKKKLWVSSFGGAGLWPHFVYNNSGINLDVHNNIYIHGRESYGDYSEILDIKTGKILAHKQHSKDYNKSAGKK